MVALSEATTRSLRRDDAGVLRLTPPEQIRTQRLLLRPAGESDAEAIFDGYASNASATRLLNFERHVRVEQSIALAQIYQRCWRESIAFPWCILRRCDGQFLGVFELFLTPPRAEFGYVVCEPFWGQGFATEAVNAVVQWALAQPQIYRVGATCHPENLASARVLSKAGLRFEATLDNWEARPQLGEAAGPSLSFVRTRPA